MASSLSVGQTRLRLDLSPTHASLHTDQKAGWLIRWRRSSLGSCQEFPRIEVSVMSPVAHRPEALSLVRQLKACVGDSLERPLRARPGVFCRSSRPQLGPLAWNDRSAPARHVPLPSGVVPVRSRNGAWRGALASAAGSYSGRSQR
jgi:hypothetical protein